jgi:nucleotide-binding universal stress UspA family protein
MTDNVIVVGVDGSAPSREALRWAADQARLIGATLHAVMAWEYPVHYAWGPMEPYVDWAENAGKVLAETVAHVLGGDDTITARESVLAGHPAHVLIEAARDARLLVVGSRGHGGFTGALLGSVSQYCAHHATCPVVIVPAKIEPDDD